jgi:phosphoadenosine phosphosulfate reductase
MPATDKSAVNQRVASLTRSHGHLDGAALLHVMIEREFPGRIAVVSSFGSESAVILNLVAEIDPTTPVLFLDTRMHFTETLIYRDALAERLGLAEVRVIGPDPVAVDAQDPAGRLWQSDAERCCYLRKVLPLRRALRGFDAWITGRKRYQGGTRAVLEPIEADGGRIKINPIASWSSQDIEAAFEFAELPRHPLAGKGYTSIGCAPCTRPVRSPVLEPAGRAGRWAETQKTECGIHWPEDARP